MRLKTKSLFANAVVLTERALAELKCDGRQLDTRIREATSLGRGHTYVSKRFSARDARTFSKIS